jgi:hypothetical protein
MVFAIKVQRTGGSDNPRWSVLGGQDVFGKRTKTIHIMFLKTRRIMTRGS